MSQPDDWEVEHKALPELLHPGSRTLFRHWERIRGERSAPNRADLDFRAISGVLTSIGILERQRLPTSFRWRVAGSGVGAVWGGEVTGHDILDDWKSFERQSLIAVLDGVVDSLQPFVARFKAIPEHGDTVAVEFLALPVRASAETVHVLCAALPFRDAAWLDTNTARRFELASVRIIWTEPVPGDPLAERRAEAASGRTAAQPFRLIRGGKSE